MEQKPKKLKKLVKSSELKSIPACFEPNYERVASIYTKFGFANERKHGNSCRINLKLAWSRSKFEKLQRHKKRWLLTILEPFFGKLEAQAN